MKIGMYLDARNPPQWRRPWPGHYERLIEWTVEAERRGLGSVWLSEHHFFEDGYLPQPLTLAAAIAARTSKLRIGTGILVAPLHPAVDIAEQAALVDVLSDGRLELGLGAGYRIPEFEAFGADVSRRFSVLEERVAEIRKLWETGLVTPPPVQESLPLWLGGNGPRAGRIAGRLGVGLLTLRTEPREHYLQALRSAGHDPRTARVSGTVNLVLARDPERAEANWRRIRPHLAYQWQSYQRYGAQGRPSGKADDGALRQVDASAADPDAMRSAGPEMNAPAFDVVTPAEAARRLRSWLSDVPVEHAFFWASIGGMPDDMVEEHLELLATELAPSVRDVGTLLAAAASRDDG